MFITIARTYTVQILCSRNLYCPVKVVDSTGVACRVLLHLATLHCSTWQSSSTWQLHRSCQVEEDCMIPTCTSTTAASCTAACHQTYNNLKSSLGCCADNLYGLSIGSYAAYESNFTACGAMLDSPCYLGSATTTSSSTSDAAGVYVNLLLVAVLMMSTVMV